MTGESPSSPEHMNEPLHPRTQTTGLLPLWARQPNDWLSTHGRRLSCSTSRTAQLEWGVPACATAALLADGLSASAAATMD